MPDRLSDDLALVNRWSIHLKTVRGLSEATVARYRRSVTTALGSKDPSVVTFDDLDTYLGSLWARGMSSATIAGTATALRSFFEYLTIIEIIKKSPAHRLQGPRVYTREAPHLTAGEIERLLFAGGRNRMPVDPMAARNRVLLAVAYVCGLRVSEPGNLRLEHLEYTDGCYSILLERTKFAAEDVRMPIADPTVSRMLGHFLAQREQIAESSPWIFPSRRRSNKTRLSSRSVDRIFHAARAESSIRKRGRRITFHILRHSIATHLSGLGWPQKAIQKWLRHRDPATTARYIHVSENELRSLWRRKNPLRRHRAHVPDVHAVGRQLVQDLSSLWPSPRLKPNGHSDRRPNTQDT